MESEEKKEKLKPEHVCMLHTSLKCRFQIAIDRGCMLIPSEEPVFATCKYMFIASIPNNQQIRTPERSIRRTSRDNKYAGQPDY